MNKDSKQTKEGNAETSQTSADSFVTNLLQRRWSGCYSFEWAHGHTFIKMLYSML